jgi:hypothetical protein
MGGGKGEGGGKGRNVASGHTMFTFGRSYGFLRGCLVSLKIPFDEVTPVIWQRSLAIPPRKTGESRTARKTGESGGMRD